MNKFTDVDVDKSFYSKTSYKAELKVGTDYQERWVYIRLQAKFVKCH